MEADSSEAVVSGCGKVRIKSRQVKNGWFDRKEMKAERSEADGSEAELDRSEVEAERSEADGSEKELDRSEVEAEVWKRMGQKRDWTGWKRKGWKRMGRTRNWTGQK